MSKKLSQKQRQRMFKIHSLICELRELGQSLNRFHGWKREGDEVVRMYERLHVLMLQRCFFGDEDDCT